MKKIAFIYLLLFTAYNLSAENIVSNIKLLDVSSKTITIVWSSIDSVDTGWKISCVPHGNTSSFIPIEEVSVGKDYNIFEPNTYVYKINNLQPDTEYDIAVIKEGENENEVKPILAKTTKSYNVSYQTPQTCSSFRPLPDKFYLISCWLKKDKSEPTYTDCGLQISIFINGQEVYSKFIKPTGAIIDGWQKVEGTFIIDKQFVSTDALFNISLINASNYSVYFDDVRIVPQNGNLKSFVYDYVNKKLKAELDENNYATFYEYDLEGGLIRIKKETERGIYTIQETRSHTIKKENN